MGRVIRGIDTVLGSETKAEKARARVVLVAGQNWIQKDKTYRAEFVDKLKSYVTKTWEQTPGLDIVCDDMVLSLIHISEPTRPY